MATMRTMAGILAGMMMSASHNGNIDLGGLHSMCYFPTIVKSSKPTKKRLKIKLARKANLQRIKNHKK